MIQVVIRIDQEVRNAFQPECVAACHAIANGTNDATLNPVVDEYHTKGMGGAGDRDAASVTWRHAKAMLIQAKRGVLTRAAAGAGYEVNSR